MGWTSLRAIRDSLGWVVTGWIVRSPAAFGTASAVDATLCVSWMNDNSGSFIAGPFLNAVSASGGMMDRTGGDTASPVLAAGDSQLANPPGKRDPGALFLEDNSHCNLPTLRLRAERMRAYQLL